MAARKLDHSALLDAITKKCERFGYPPTMDELADTLGVVKSIVHKHIHQLIGAGKLAMEPGKPRTLRVVKG